MEYIRKFWRFVIDSGKEELFWECVGWVGDHYFVGGSAFLISLAMSTWASVVSADAKVFVAVFVFVVVFSVLISAAHFAFRLQEARMGQGSGPLPRETRPLKMLGVVKDSQIALWAQLDLQVDIAVRFENSETTQRFIRGFNVYITRGESKEKLEQPSLIEISALSRKVTLDNGLAIKPGISPLYYLKFHVPSFTKEDQCFEIEMEALGQFPQRIAIVPNWANVQPLLLNANTVKEIRFLN